MWPFLDMAWSPDSLPKIYEVHLFPLAFNKETLDRFLLQIWCHAPRLPNNLLCKRFCKSWRATTVSHWHSSVSSNSLRCKYLREMLLSWKHGGQNMTKRKRFSSSSRSGHLHWIERKHNIILHLSFYFSLCSHQKLLQSWWKWLGIGETV